jgi:ABC-type nickel/cobalt efflux system permease component RcnA
MDDELLHLATAQTLDLLFAVLSLALFTLYHAWYYSWHWYPANGEPRFHRLDRTGQTARQLFTQVRTDPNTNMKKRSACDHHHHHVTRRRQCCSLEASPTST